MLNGKIASLASLIEANEKQRKLQAGQFEGRIKALEAKQTVRDQAAVSSTPQGAASTVLLSVSGAYGQTPPSTAPSTRAALSPATTPSQLAPVSTVTVLGSEAVRGIGPGSVPATSAPLTATAPVTSTTSPAASSTTFVSAAPPSLAPPAAPDATISPALTRGISGIAPGLQSAALMGLGQPSTPSTLTRSSSVPQSASPPPAYAAPVQKV